MQITGKASFNDLPQVKDFSFFISGISVSNLNPVYFLFYDTQSNVFSFNFYNGFLKTDKTTYLYNTNELIDIQGYVKNNKFYYKINDIEFETNNNFSYLDKIFIDSIDTKVSFDLFVNSEPINYSFQVNNTYPFTGILSGKIITDVPFYIKDYSLSFKNSNAQLLSGNSNLTGKMLAGNNVFTLKDIDASYFQYLNLFSINFETIFGNLLNDFSSYRDGLYNKKILSLKESPFNVYEKTLLFNGSWNNNEFEYFPNNENYNLTFLIDNIDYLGVNYPSLLSFKLESFSPLNKNSYISEYVTGFELINQGNYSGKPPEAVFSKYYYVEGVSQSLNNLLFSTGCQDTIKINYLGNSTGEASGYLTLKNVRLNNFYGNGVNTFKAAFNYNPYSNGSGYTGAPIIIWQTGGNCFSIADSYGESGQFKKIHNTFARINSHADYLTGIVLTSGIKDNNNNVTGFVVTGLSITNIGSGYNSTFPPFVKFIRSQNDILNNDASGNLLYKKSGLYNFLTNWSINYNFPKENSIFFAEDLLDFNNLQIFDVNNNEINLIPINYYSGDINVPSDKKYITFNIGLSGLDNSKTISSLLTLKLKNEFEEKTIQKYIKNNRYYNPLTGV